jgi:hypothetical protein
MSFHGSSSSGSKQLFGDCPVRCAECEPLLSIGDETAPPPSPWLVRRGSRILLCTPNCTKGGGKCSPSPPGVGNIWVMHKLWCLGREIGT